ncbi:type 11 methyltransferase [Natrialba hulunbeirensis JCM 10989]|uniref:Type 11 methyltransferase n=1 Tax=Natrialba hulunbeirensis JCM 10989 TaxID=1227493 RepID=M0A5H3_9EURY|nr:class I SAM-dependent methyltransferase [Natrialba hulunbeirensis]ELY92593.1 type 11 methyltransferase [Natrialba hulunbeirensis JCM 10989]
MTPSPFETHTDTYDDWFDTNDGAYRAEQAALESVCPAPVPDRALEIGVGTGRFAGPLDVSLGVDPASAPLDRARERGVTPVRGVAESLPFDDGGLEYVQFVTVLSFVDEPTTALTEARRVLEQDGTLVVAFLDRASPVGEVYQEHKDESPFYADAEFLTADEASAFLESAGFDVEARVQTIFEDPSELESADIDVREGHGDGLFAVVRATPL